MFEAVAERSLAFRLFDANRNFELGFREDRIALFCKVHHVAIYGIAKPPASVALN
ncbi:hypothetical protein [Stieleria magnilauensis]|uniref:hypothetical protein n=1 Tax=Stieleria magnilauensis TaxID=2527963 RepID=UPI003AF92037